MASAPAAKPYISYAEYLALEEKSVTKHEWLDGVVHAGGRRGVRRSAGRRRGHLNLVDGSPHR
jgi:hypothetical protein